jgi:hypothetical protein
MRFIVGRATVGDVAKLFDKFQNPMVDIFACRFTLSYRVVANWSIAERQSNSQSMS